MAAMAAANDGHAASYGRDDLTARAQDRVREVFDAPDAQVFLLGTGTGANALALAQLCPPWGRIFCHETAHIETSESGAPAWMAGGAQLALVGGEHVDVWEIPTELSLAVIVLVIVIVVLCALVVYLRSKMREGVTRWAAERLGGGAARARAKALLWYGSATAAALAQWQAEPRDVADVLAAEEWARRRASELVGLV